jgi:hypothetical protein
MSLKHFHIIFISVAVVLCLIFGLWSVQAYYQEMNFGYLSAGIFSFCLSLGLIIYGVIFLKKLKEHKF